MEIDFSELDYTKMIANPMVVPIKQSPEDYYDIFKKYREFIQPVQGLDRGKLFRYIALVYDKNSPLHGVISELSRIKSKAAELAGFAKKNDSRFHPRVEEVFQCINREVNMMIVRYVTLHKSAKYQEMVVLKEAHVKLSVKVIEEPEQKYINAFTTIGSKIDEITQELLSRDNSALLKDDLDNYYFGDKLELRPEDIARKRSEGRPFVD